MKVKKSVFGSLMKLRLSLLLGGLVLAGTAHAVTLTLPGPNDMSTGPLHNNVYVYPLELLPQCAPTDSRCAYTGTLPVQSNTGNSGFGPLIQVYEAGGGDSNYGGDPLTGTLSTIRVDEPFRAPSGNVNTFEMSSANEPGGPPHATNGTAEFTGDLIGTWDASLKTIASYLKGHDLVFLFDNVQQGKTAGNYLAVWAQVKIYDNNGSVVTCYELSNDDAGTDCGAVPSLTNFEKFVVAGEFCVDNSSGNAVPTYTSKSTCEAAGNYWLSNNLGSNSVEFAAFIPGLNSNLASWAADDYTMSINLKMLGIDGGADALAICDQCDIRQVPEPSSALLIGLGLLGLGFSMRRAAK